MNIEERAKKIKLKGREKLMVNKMRLSPDGEPLLRGVAPNLQKKYIEYGWEFVVVAPVEAKKPRRTRKKVVKNEVDTDK